MTNQDIKSSITITYMEHFDELNFSVISCELINFENVSVNMKGSVLIGSFEVLILPENTFGLNGLTIKGFDVKNDESWYEVNFHFNCKPKKSLPAFEKSLSIIPVSEIVNDDIFCHRHDHSHTDVHSSTALVDEKTCRQLSSIDQIRYLLASKLAFENLLIQSANSTPEEYLSFDIIHPRLLVASKKNLKTETANELSLKRCTIFDYKHLVWDKDELEIRKLRQSFETDWYLISKANFVELINILIENDLTNISIKTEIHKKQSYL